MVSLSWFNTLPVWKWWSGVVMMLCLWVGLIYSNALSAGLVMDDGKVITEDLLEFVDAPVAYSKRTKARVVTNATFAVQYSLNQADPVGYHLVNILIHLINSILVFWLVRTFFTTPTLATNHWQRLARPISLTTAVIFASHPLQTMAVTYVTQRYQSLASLWAFVSIGLFIMGRRRLFEIKQADKDRSNSLLVEISVLWLLSLLAFVLAFSSKETTAILPLVVLLIEAILFRRGQFPRWLFASAAIVGSLGAALALLIYPIEFFFYTTENSAGELIGPATYALTQTRVWLVYVLKFLAPWPLKADYHFPISETVFDPRVIIGLGLWLAVWYLVWRYRRQQPLIAFGLGWWLLAPLVDSSLVPVLDVINEYRVYLAMLGSSLVVSALLWQWRLAEKWGVYLIFGLMLALGVLTFNRNYVYRDGLSFWGDVIKKSPQKARAYVNYGVELHSRGEGLEALKYYQLALDRDPRRLTALSNLGVIYTQLGQFDRGVEYFNRALEVDAHYVDALNGLGVVYLNTDHLADAEVKFRQVLILEPDNRSALDNLKLIQRVDE